MKIYTKEHPICEKCDSVLFNKEDGYIVHGSIYRSELLENDTAVVIDGITMTDDSQILHKTAYCNSCFIEVLGI